MAKALVKRAVRAWLGANGRTQAWLANRIGVTEGHLSVVLSGQRSPSDALVKDIERITGIDITDVDKSTASSTAV